MTRKQTKPTQPKIHDAAYKKLFSNRTIFQQLIETFITEAWVKDLDFSTCETLDKSFITDHYKATESDLIYKLKLRRKTVYIYILLEFQSKSALERESLQQGTIAHHSQHCFHLVPGGRPL
jgi:predicted transposase YdaD